MRLGTFKLRREDGRLNMEESEIERSDIPEPGRARFRPGAKAMTYSKRGGKRKKELHGRGTLKQERMKKGQGGFGQRVHNAL